MAKFTREDERDEGEPRRDGGGGNAVLVAVLVAAAALVLVCGVGLMAFLFIGARARVEAVQAEAEADLRTDLEARREAVAKALRTREEWRKELVGKSKDEVLAVLGEPDTNDEGVFPNWLYRNRSMDPVSLKVDEFMHVYWDKTGRVESVTFGG
jgi:hypothetical protein